MRTHLKLYPALVAVVMLGVLILGTGVAAAHGDRGKTLRLVAVDPVEELIDVGVPGLSLGDELVFSDPGPFEFAITGGTGKYRGAGGEATFRLRDSGRGVWKLRFDDHKKKKHGDDRKR